MVQFSAAALLLVVTNAVVVDAFAPHATARAFTTQQSPYAATRLPFALQLSDDNQEAVFMPPAEGQGEPADDEELDKVEGLGRGAAKVRSMISL
jgi:hypothetical protein